jgi:hypothetical protein
VVVAWGFIGLGGNNQRVLFRMIDPNAASTLGSVRQANSSASNTMDIGNPVVHPTSGGKFSISWGNWTNYTVYQADFASNGVIIQFEYPIGRFRR